MCIRDSLHGIHEVTVAGGTVHERGFKLFIRGAQLQKKLQHLVMHGGGIGMRTVDLVNDDNGHQPFLKGLAEHKTRLGLRSFKSVHHQKHAIHHFHHALHFPAEIRVSGSIHNVDRVSIPEDGCILGLDRDAFFTFQIHGCLLYTSRCV